MSDTFTFDANSPQNSKVLALAAENAHRERDVLRETYQKGMRDHYDRKRYWRTLLGFKKPPFDEMKVRDWNAYTSLFAYGTHRDLHSDRMWNSRTVLDYIDEISSVAGVMSGTFSIALHKAQSIAAFAKVNLEPANAA